MALKRAGCFGCWLDDLLGGLVRLLGEKDSLDVGEDTALSDGDSGEQLVQLLVVPDGQLEVAGDDPGLLVVAGSVASQLEDLSGEVLHDGGQIDGGSGTNTGGVVTLPQETVDTAHGELESSTAGAGLGLGLNFSSLTTSGHFESLKFEFKLMQCGGCGGLYPRPRLNSTNGHTPRPAQVAATIGASFTFHCVTLRIKTLHLYYLICVLTLSFFRKSPISFINF